MSNFGDKMKYFFGLNDDVMESNNEITDSSKSDNKYSSDEKKSSYITNSEKSKFIGGNSSVKDSIIYNKTFKPVKEEVTNSTSKENKKMTICKYSPINYAETTSIIDDIKDGFPVIINFEATEDFTSANILKACEGGAYALNAEIKKIANEIFLVVPSGVDVLNHVEVESDPDYNGKFNG